MTRSRSKRLFDKAQELIPGGVSSPVRAFKAVGGDPLFIARAEGPHLFDVDNNRYIDYVCSWGPLILGHAPDSVTEAVVEAAKDGTSYGTATPKEVELAERVVNAVPYLERVRFVNSGTEATMSALRVARGTTGRDRVVKFEGCYHGHADAFMTAAGSGIATLGIPGTQGVPTGTAQDTITVPYNDLEKLEGVMNEVGETVAAIIVEPVACNMGLVEPKPGFLEGLRSLCDQHGSLLIFDEVITGFRVALGGAQELYNVRPDLSTFGKIIGGGLPVGAYGGRADLMNQVAPEGPIYQAGTLSGNPLAMAAGIATFDKLSQAGFYEQLQNRCQQFGKELQEVLDKHGNPAKLCQLGSIFYLWFAASEKQKPENYTDIQAGNAEFYRGFFQRLLEQGVYLAPSAFEVGFVSDAHSPTHLAATCTAMDQALTELS